MSSPCTQRLDKPFMKIGNKEIVYYSLKAFEKSPLISEVIIVSKVKNITKFKKLIERERFKKIKVIVEGGRTRSLSVRNGLCYVSEDVDLVLVHDCARPFLSEELIKKTVSAAKKHRASLAAVLVKPTIKKTNSKGSFVEATIDRKFLWEAQTPQVFKKELLVKGYDEGRGKKAHFTDDASVVEAIGVKVKIVKSSYTNIKITTPDDLVVADAILKKVIGSRL